MQRAEAQAVEPPTVALHYRASRACPSEAVLVREVDAMLGRVAFDAAGRFTLDVDVATDPTHAAIVLAAPDGTVLGTRRVELDGSCRALLGPLALVVALLAEVPAETRDVRITLLPPPVEPARVDEPNDGHRDEPARSADGLSGARSAEDAGARMSLSLLGGVELGLGPEPSALTGVGLGVAPLPGLLLQLDLLALPYATTRGADDVGLDRTTFAAFVDACFVPGAEALGASLAICADVGGGASLGAGRGLDVGRTASVAWLVAGAALRMQVPLDASWFVGGWLRAGANLVRPSFAYQDVPADARVLVLRASELEAAGGLELGVRGSP